MSLDILLTIVKLLSCLVTALIPLFKAVFPGKRVNRLVRRTRRNGRNARTID